MMSATMASFVFRVSILFCKNVGFLATSFSMFEIQCWSVSVTSTNTASDLLKSFASLVFRGLRLVLSSDIVGDILVDLLCASASMELVRRDLELMNVVHHCRNLVAFLVPN